MESGHVLRAPPPDAPGSVPEPELMRLPPPPRLPQLTDLREVATRPSAPPQHVDALAEHDDEHEAIAHHFFSRAPHSSYPEPWHDTHDVTHTAPRVPRAMVATLVMLGGSLLLIGAFAAYHQWIMPTPVELGSALGPELPSVVAPHLVAASNAPAARSEREPEVTSPHVPQAAFQATAFAESKAVSALAPGTQVATPAYDDLVRVGRELSQSGRMKAAIDAYQHALSLRPDAAEPLARLAYFRLNAGDAHGAKRYAERALLADPTSSEGFIVLGAAQAALGEHAAARAAYRRCAVVGVGAFVRECQQLVR